MELKEPVPSHSSAKGGEVERLSLSEKQKKLADVVYKIAKEETDSEYYSVDDDEGSEDMQQQQLKIKRLVRTFKNYNKQRQKFLSIFPEWKKFREEHIQLLNDLVELMNSTSFNCNVSKLVGESASLIGGGVCLSAALVPPAAPVLIPLAIAGGVVSAAGGLTTVGATIADFSLLKKRIREVTGVLKIDEKIFRLMESWIQHTQELAKQVEDIIGLDVMNQLMDIINEFCEDVKKCDDFTSEVYDAKFREVVRKCMQIMRDSGNEDRKFGILLKPIIMSLVFVMIVMPTKNRFAFNYLMITAKFAMGAFPLVEAGAELVQVCLKLAMKKTLVGAVKGAGAANTAVAIVKHCSLPTIGIALDIASIAITSIDVHKGSVRKQAVQVKKAADHLENELNYLQQMYDQLQKKPRQAK